MTATTRERIDALIDAFENEWRGRRRPDIGAYLSRAAESERSSLMRELVGLDLEYRLRAGEAARVEECLSRFPSLRAEPTVTLDLIALEYRVRLDCEERVTIAEYLERFPTLRDELPATLDPWRRGPPDVPGYEIVEELGRGGMGVVYRAVDREFGRPVAVKVVQGGRTDYAEAVRRFLEEARITGQLQHPGIPPVHRLGTLIGGQPFLAMKLIQGRTLADLLSQRANAAAELSRFLQVFESVCQTVAYAHQQGVVHRDLKPSNVMVGAFGEVQVMDWGLAKLLGAAGGGSAQALAANAPSETQTGMILGTPAYMPPEQARGEQDRVDARSDVFALGAILCEILTGQPPYLGSANVLESAQNARLDLAQQRLKACGADAKLVDLARRCLAPTPADRPVNAAAVAETMGEHRIAVEQKLRAAESERAATLAKTVEERKRRRVQLWLAASVLLLVCGAALFAWLADSQARERRSELAVRGGSARTAIETALNQAEKSLREDKPAEVKIALAEAQRRLDADAHADPQQEMTGRLETLQKQLAFLLDLNGIRDRQGTSMAGAFDDAAARRDFPRVFRDYGIDRNDAKAVVERLRDWPIREQVLGALDLWLSVENKQTGLPEALAALDPDAKRNAWRAAIVANNKDGQIESAGRLTDPVQPPRFLAAHAEKLPSADALRLLRPAWERHPDSHPLAFTLALVLSRGTAEQKEEALGFYRVCIALQPGHTASLINLGLRLHERKDTEGAIAYFQRAIAADPGRAQGHYNLGFALHSKNDVEGAIAAYRSAIRTGPTLGRAYTNLGTILMEKGDQDVDRPDEYYDEAFKILSKATEVNEKDYRAHNTLGLILNRKGDFEAASRAFKKAIEVAPWDATSHCNLGLCLSSQGRFTEAIDALNRGDQLCQNEPLFNLPSGQWLQQALQLREQDARLTRIRDGAATPASAAEYAEFGTFCALNCQRYVEAMQFFVEAGRLDANFKLILRYRLACAGIRAANGDGVNPPDAKDRPALRKQSLDLLHDELAFWRKSHAAVSPAVKDHLRKMLAPRLREPDLTCVRDAASLAKLPDEERQAWQKYWADIRLAFKEATAAPLAKIEKLPPEPEALDPWVEIGNAASRFKALMPGRPEVKNRTENQTDSVMYEFARGDTVYMVHVAFLPQKIRPVLAELQADSTVELMTKFEKAKVIQRKVLSTGDVVGREFTLELPGNRLRRLRSFAVDNRLHNILLEGPKDAVTTKDADRFIDSLKLLDR